eukprot:6213001-Pleurochrysis_carterae.AAC.1
MLIELGSPPFYAAADISGILSIRSVATNNFCHSASVTYSPIRHWESGSHWSRGSDAGGGLARLRGGFFAPVRAWPTSPRCALALKL